MPDKEQNFLNDLDKKLWNAADKFRSTLDAAQYKHAVLGLLFVKYVSDACDIRRHELMAQFKNTEHDYFLDPVDYDSDDEYLTEVADELEIRDYYTEENVFWVQSYGAGDIASIGWKSSRPTLIYKGIGVSLLLAQRVYI